MNVPLPWRRPADALRHVAGVLPEAGEDDRGLGPARGVEADDRWQGLADDLDGGKSGESRLPVRRRDRGDRRADEADGLVRAEQRDGRLDAGNGQRRREIDGEDAGMGAARTQHGALELAVVTDVERVFGGARHLRLGLDARRRDGVAVEAPGAGLGHGAQDVGIGAAAAEMAR